MTNRIRLITDEDEHEVIYEGVFSFSGRQESPLTYEIDGFVIPLFSDEQVHTSSREILVDSLDALVEKELGLEITSNNASVRDHYALREKNPVIKSLSITRQAFVQTHSIAETIGEVYSPTPEIAMHLLRHKDAPEGLITDVVPAMRQTVSPTHCRYSSYLCFDYQHTNRSYAGWSHSHADGPTFHSSIDNGNLIRRLRTEGLRVPVESEYDIDINYTPSLVVNARRGPVHCVMGLRYFSHRDEEYKTLLRQVPLNLVNKRYGISDIDLKSFITQEVSVGR